MKRAVLLLLVTAGCRDRHVNAHADNAAAKSRTAVELCLDLERAKLLLADRCEHELVWIGPLEHALTNARRGCELRALAAGVVFDANRVKECISALAVAECSASAPAVCTRNGVLPDGAACAFPEQCGEHSNCVFEYKRCGLCTPGRALGESCDEDHPCEPQLKCPTYTEHDRRCVRPGLAGDRCSKYTCAAGLYCGQNTTADPHTCLRPAAEGAECHRRDWIKGPIRPINRPERPCAHHLTCVAANCVKRHTVGAGEPCDDLFDCRDGMYCDGVCIARGGAGSTCGSKAGEWCRDGYLCVDHVCLEQDARHCK